MSSSKSKASAPQQCKWSGCEAYQSGAEFASVDELARHVRVSHVEPFEVSFTRKAGESWSVVNFTFSLVSGHRVLSVGRVQGLQRPQFLDPMAPSSCAAVTYQGQISVEHIM